PLGPPLAHGGEVRHVAFGPDARVLLTASTDGTGVYEARLWDAATGKPLSSPVVHPGEVRTASLSRDGKTALRGRDKGVVGVEAVPAPLPGEVGRLVLWSQVVTGMELDEHDAVRVLDAETWRQRRQLLQALGGAGSP